MEELVGQDWTNADPVVRDWINSSVEQIGHVLGANHVGSYLHGSLAAGAYYPPKSDVDLLFVCEDRMQAASRQTISKLCVDLHDVRPIVGGLECSVVRLDTAQRAIHPAPFEVHFSEQWVEAVRNDEVDYELHRRDPDLIAHFQAVRESGIALAGPEPGAVFGPVGRADFLQAVQGDLDWILSENHILESPVYGILNSCRSLWLRSGHSDRLVPSKEEAAVWCLSRLQPQLGRIVERALAVHRSGRAVTPDERRTGGEVWDADQLCGFRDYVKQVVSGGEMNKSDDSSADVALNA